MKINKNEKIDENKLKKEILTDIKRANKTLIESDSTLIEQNKELNNVKMRTKELDENIDTSKKYVNGFNGFFGFFRYVFSSNKNKLEKKEEKIENVEKKEKISNEEKKSEKILNEEKNLDNKTDNKNNNKIVIEENFYDQLQQEINQMNKINKGIGEKLDASSKGIDQIDKKIEKNQKSLQNLTKDLDKILNK